MTYEAQDLSTRDIYTYRSLDGLAQRLGGDSYQLKHVDAYWQPTRHVQILRDNPQAGGRDILAIVIVDTADLDEMARDAERAEAQMTRDEVAEHCGIAPSAVSSTMTRWGVPAIGRESGRGGQSIYDRAAVVEAHTAAPGQGRRTDLRGASESA